MEHNLLALKKTLSEDDDEEHKSIDKVLALIREEQSKKIITWEGVWEETWRHTAAKYWETYAMDCIVWPPLQLINFTFVPVQYQVLPQSPAVHLPRANDGPRSLFCSFFL
jgi:hypothetical protein